MPIHKTIFTGVFFFILLVPPCCAGEKSNIEFYLSGKKYRSFADYKLERLHLLAGEEGALQSPADVFLKKDLLTKITDKELEEYSAEELRSILQKLRQEELARQPAPLTEEQAQMQELLKEYKKNHNDAVSVAIDPAKLKTIHISSP